MAMVPKRCVLFNTTLSLSPYSHRKPMAVALISEFSTQATASTRNGDDLCILARRVMVSGFALACHYGIAFKGYIGQKFDIL